MADTQALEAQLLFQILPRVSRSFYLSLRILPKALRRPIGLAYLFCRGADAIADTPILPPEQRLECLGQYRAAFFAKDSSRSQAFQTALQTDIASHQENKAERELLMHVDDCFTFLATLSPSDQTRIRKLVLTLTQGIQMDLTVFPSGEEGQLGQVGQIGALETRHALDQYTYFVAGCVGEFWTKVSLDHIPSLRHWHTEEMCKLAVRFGKGLQLTNILRDMAQDLRIGRCYLPHTDLAALGIEPTQLLQIATIEQVRPLLDELLDLTLSCYQDGWAYIQAIPRREWQMRLACTWPLLIGASTLRLLRGSPSLLDPSVRLKIPRSRVYRLLLGSLVSVWSNRTLALHYYSLLS